MAVDVFSSLLFGPHVAKTARPNRSNVSLQNVSGMGPANPLPMALIVSSKVKTEQGGFKD